MPDIDRMQAVSKLHETMYEQSLLYLALRTRPDCEAKLAETRERIIRIYSRIQSLS
jgi:hypothetical protein